MKKYLILIAGCPATGKTYLINKIKEAIPDLYTVTPDEGKEMLADSIGFDSKLEKIELEKRAWEFYYKALDLYMSVGKKVIVSEYPFSDKQKDKLANLASIYSYEVITIRLIADFDVLWERRRKRDLSSSIHLYHIMTHYHYKDTLIDHSLADDLITKEEFKEVIKQRKYNEFQLGELIEFDVTDYQSVDYEPFIRQLKKRVEDDV